MIFNCYNRKFINVIDFIITKSIEFNYIKMSLI